MILSVLICLLLPTNALHLPSGNGFSRNPASSSSNPGRKGFSNPSSSSRPMKESLEVAIQRNIDQTPGLREAMAFYESVEANQGLLQVERNSPWSRAQVHHKLLEVTWDTSARFREDRHQNSVISYEAERFMMDIAEQVLQNSKTQSRILDVGCGTGILFKYIKQYASMKKLPVKDENMYGIDLSSEMIKICREKYPSSVFTNGDFLEYRPDGILFSSVILNECLHNFLDTRNALRHAVDLLHSGGILIVSHPRGYSNILTQHRANKWLVPSVLPSEKEWENEISRELDLELIISPKLKSNQYLAVVKKK